MTLRSRYTFLTLLLLLPLCLRAQVGEYRSDLAVGVGGGCAINRVDFSPTIRQTFRPGAMAGVTLRYTCERYFGLLCALQLDVNYAQMGWHEVLEGSPDTYDRRLDYIQAPILARLAYGREHRGVQGFLVLGPQLGYYIGSHETRRGPWDQASMDQRLDKKTEQYKPISRPFEYGITGGLGIELSTRVGHFTLEGRYFYGLSDMFPNGKKDYFARSANGTIYARVGYLIDVVRTKK